MNARGWIGIAVLALGLFGSGTAAARSKGKADPGVAEGGRFTVIADRAGGRTPEALRQLRAQDLFLGGWLSVPESQLAQPVTLLYLHRTRGMDRKLPFRGDRVGQEYLVPTDTRLWVLVPEETGLEDLRPATLQVAEYGLLRIAGELPPWLRAGMYELMARLQLQDDALSLAPAPFPALHAAGVARTTLAAAAEPGWNRYQEPRRWYTSTLVVAYLFERDPSALSAALADPGSFTLGAEVDHAEFDAWVEGIIAPGERTARVLGSELGLTTLESGLSEERLQSTLAELALTHPRGLKPFHLRTDDLPAAVPLRAASLTGVQPSGCGALWGTTDPEQRYLLGLCLARDAPHAAEEILRQLFRNEPGLPRAALQAAAMALERGGRDADAGRLVEQALAVAPADPDAQLLWALIRVRAGDCVGWDEEAEGRLAPPWDPLPYAPGPLEAARDAFVREILECRSGAESD